MYNLTNKKIRVVETFSGIGSQAKALSNINADFEIVATVEWDINAIIAYDAIHFGAPELEEDKTKEELVQKMSNLGLSGDGKSPISEKSLARKNIEVLRRLDHAIERSNNLVDIQNVHARDLPENLDILTYSFPCQDLSLGGAWHGNDTGIDREAGNRSGMLWEIERIILEFSEENMVQPRILLMENVSNILSAKHKSNFEEWKSVLVEKGYKNFVLTNNALYFGIPQNRKRTFMISVYVDDLSDEKRKLVNRYWSKNKENLKREKGYAPANNLQDFIKNDYSNGAYIKEALENTPNKTPSRDRIHNENERLNKSEGIYATHIKTITTKQDRNPNSGVIDLFDEKILNILPEHKSRYRYLTPRECIMLMGFDECDYDRMLRYDFKINKNTNFFSSPKVVKYAGNSIVVNVLEEIFKSIIHFLKIVEE